MVTTKLNSMIDIHTKKKKESKYNTKETHQIRRKKSYKNKSKTINKMAIRTYMLIITLHVKLLNAPTIRHRLAE